MLILLLALTCAPLPPAKIQPGVYDVGGWTLALGTDGRACYTRERFEENFLPGRWSRQHGAVKVEQWGETYFFVPRSLRRLK